jgi:hypothetical protein
MEHIKNIVAWELLFILVFSSLLVISSIDDLGINTITGRAVQLPTKADVLSQIEAVIPNLEFKDDVQDVSVCLIVNMDATTKYSYEIVKIGEAPVVTVADSLLCKGTASEDFIVSYVSYEKLKEQLDVPPTFQELKQTSGGQNFYVYPSKQIETGMKIKNPQEFNEKFQIILEKNFNSAEIKALQTASSPESRQTASLTSYVFYFVVGMIVLVGILVVSIMKVSKKPEIKEDLELIAYIKSMLAQGYAVEQIQQTLVQNGWGGEKVQDALKTINKGVSEPQAAANQ